MYVGPVQPTHQKTESSVRHPCTFTSFFATLPEPVVGRPWDTRT
ncbi:hypothetical protein [Sphaerimonospora thailandensis]|nr:hypothetical protein [Sphaerimonospora thailandensis]